jgi:type II secretory pathway predicted ATPase ExeA/cell division septation protein DedD
MDRPGPVPFGRSQHGRSSFLTYEPYYGLTEKPFSLSADPKFLYRSPSHASTFDELLLGIRRREGLIVLTGDIGTGKTTLCRAVLERLDRKTFSTFVPDPFLSREDLLKMLLIDFGVMSVDDLKSGRLNGASRPDLSYPLYEFLNSLVPLQAFAVLIIDEAQNLPLSLLEEIRILSDLEAPEKLLQVVLVGQLEFRSKLKLPEMRQLDQRVSVRCGLEPLNCEGVAGYIAHRLQIAGAMPNRVAFTDEAVDVIFEASHGVPRLVNLICDRALTRGSLWHETELDSEVVALAVADLGVGDLRPAPAAFEPEMSDSPILDFHVDRLDDQTRVLAGASDEADDTRLLRSFQRDSPTDEKEERPAHQWKHTDRLLVVTGMLVLALVLMLVTRSRIMLLFETELAEAMSLPAGPSAALPISAPIRPPRIEPGSSSETARTEAPPARVPQVSNSVAGADDKRYAIDVALFASAWRADRLVKELAAAGYSTYQVLVDLGPAGQKRVVLVGNYLTEAEAERDLIRIRQIPGYIDARVIPAPSRRLP